MKAYHFLYVISLFTLLYSVCFSLTPPYTDAQAFHYASIENDWGWWKHANSDSDIDEVGGHIYHNSWVDTQYASGQFYRVNDKILSEFSVPTSGYYSITYGGTISGGFWNVSASAILGKAKGSGDLWIDTDIIQEPLWSRSGKDLYTTDLSAGALIEEFVWGQITSFLKISDFLGALDTIVSKYVPVIEWNNDPFSISSIPIYLEADKTYTWRFSVNSITGSSSLGAAYNVATFDLDVYLNNVDIELIRSQGNNPLLTDPQVSPQSGVDGTSFEYTVKYYDIDGDIPDFIRVFIDGIPHDMTLKSGSAVNGTYSFTTTLSPGQHEYYFSTMDVQGGINTTNVYSGPSVAGIGDDFTIYSTPWDDDNNDSDRDGVVEGWERADMQIQLRAKTDVQYVEATLTSPHGDVEIEDEYNWYGNMNSGEKSYGDGDYSATLNFNRKDQCFFILTVEYNKNNIPYTQQLIFDKKVWSPGDYSGFSTSDYTLDDSVSIRDQNIGDGIFQSGEEVRIRPRLCNEGLATATYVDVTLLYEGTDLEVMSGDRRYDDIAPGGCSYPRDNRYFWVAANKDFTGTAYLDMQIIWDQGSEPLIIPNAVQVEVQPAPWIYVSPRHWDFGVTGTDVDIVKTIEIRNRGTMPLQVTAINITNPAAVWTGDSLPWSIPAGQNKQIEVVLETENLQGSQDFNVIFISNGRLADTTPLSDRCQITGLVSDAYPVYPIPGVTNGEYPDVSGDVIVWLDYRNGNPDIYAYDLSEGIEIPICTEPHNQVEVRISGNLIAWTDWRNDDGSRTNPDLYGYDLNTGQEFIISSEPYFDRLIGVSQGKVAFGRYYYEFTEQANGRYLANLMLYDYASKNTTNITGFTSNSSHNPMQSIDAGDADFGGGMLVWPETEYFWETRYTNHYWDTRNGRTKKMQIGSDSSPVQALNTSSIYFLSADTNIFGYIDDYEDPQGYSGDQIWLWENGSPRRLTEPGLDEIDRGDDCLALDGNYAVYDIMSYPGLYYLDITTGEEFWLTEQTSNDPVDCRMDGNLIVWSRYDSSTTQREIYYMFLNQADIAVADSGITFSNDTPNAGESFDVGVTVHNFSPIDYSTDFSILLYAGEPSAGGELLDTQIINGGLAGKQESTILFEDITLQETFFIYTVVDIASGDNPSNNKASKEIVVTPPVSVPDVVGQDQFTAESRILSAGLSIGTITKVFNDTIPENDVISQDPVAESSVAPGAEVNLIVSLGGDPANPNSIPPDFNADLMTDLLWRNTDTGAYLIRLMNGTDTLSQARVPAGSRWKVEADMLADFNGDGSTDLLWRNMDTGAYLIRLMDGTDMMSQATVPAGSLWQIESLGDFNGDSKTDILWMNTDTGAYLIRLMDGTSMLSQARVPAGSLWEVDEVADFNGDAKADLLWHNTDTGAYLLRLMDGTSMISQCIVPAGSLWEVDEVADFNGDSKTDILWRNTDTGAYLIRLMDGCSMLSQCTVPAGSLWEINALGDFNGDDKTDLLWRNTDSGAYLIRLMDDCSMLSQASVPAGSLWQVDGLGDYNGDGNTDLLWRNTDTGAYLIRLMAGTDMISQASVPAGSLWEIIFP